jgi:molecular chaperone GrpE
VSEGPESGPVFRDKRRIDPETYAVREPLVQPPVVDDGTEEAAGDSVGADLVDLTEDLQRLSAEYANYRKRADRERLAAGEVAVGAVLATMLPVLDNLDRAREHGDLTGGLKAVADQLDDIFARLGLTSFGASGDPFDPVIHEAVMHNESDEVSEPTVTTLMRPGYKHGERLLRPAMVGVTDPSTPNEPGDLETPAQP